MSSANYCCWDIETSGQEDSDFGSGGTTAQMTTTTTFTSGGWDFNAVWARDDATNDGYPYFINSTVIGVRSYDLKSVMDEKGRFPKGARVQAYRVDTSPPSLVETQWLDGNGSCTFTQLPTNTTCVFHATWGGSTNRIGKWIYEAGTGDVKTVSSGGTGASSADEARDNLGIGTGDSPHFKEINLGHSSDTTLSRPSAGNLAIEGNQVTLNTDTDILGNSWVLDEDDMASNDDTKVPTQQSVKAYVDSSGGMILDGGLVTADIVTDNMRLIFDLGGV